VAGYELVERVDERRDAQRPERACQGPGQPDLCEERDAAARVAGNRRPVATHEPPAFVPRVFGHGYEQAAGLVVCERQQSQLFVSVEPGDDTRRPPAEPSGAGIEQDRPRKRRDRHVINMRGSWHRQEPTASNSWGCRRRLLSVLCRPGRSGSLGPRRRRLRPAHRPRSCRQGRGRSRGRGPVTAVRSGCRGAEADLRCGAVAPGLPTHECGSATPPPRPPTRRGADAAVALAASALVDSISGHDGVVSSSRSSPRRASSRGLP
jgi:hypothetical protein